MTSGVLEIVAIVLHFISIFCLLLIMYLTYHGNNLVSVFALANMGQHLSKLFRLIFFNFEMSNSPTWACYFHAITNFCTVGMESYLSMIFALRLWLMITPKNQIKIWLLEHVNYLTYILGLTIPAILSVFSILPQIIERQFEKPIGAQNCIAGYRTNVWQIILSGMGTMFPPLFVSLLFGVHIIYVICHVSTQNIVKDVRKFSTISYSSWIRMLWFGILFGVVVSVNVFGDIANAKNMINNGTPEPPPVMGWPYLLTACVGAGVLLIFGTTVEAKKKISSLFKKSIRGFTSTLVGSSSKRSQDITSYNTTSMAGREDSHIKPTYNNNNPIMTDTSSQNQTIYSVSADSASIDMRNAMGKKSGIPLVFMNNKKAKKTTEEDYEAALEFTNFMKTVNGIKPDDDSFNKYGISPSNNQMNINMENFDVDMDYEKMKNMEQINNGIYNSRVNNNMGYSSYSMSNINIGKKSKQFDSETSLPNSRAMYGSTNVIVNNGMMNNGNQEYMSSNNMNMNMNAQEMNTGPITPRMMIPITKYASLTKGPYNAVHAGSNYQMEQGNDGMNTKNGNGMMNNNNMNNGKYNDNNKYEDEMMRHQQIYNTSTSSDENELDDTLNDDEDKGKLVYHKMKNNNSSTSSFHKKQQQQQQQQQQYSLPSNQFQTSTSTSQQQVQIRSGNSNRGMNNSHSMNNIMLAKQQLQQQQMTSLNRKMNSMERMNNNNQFIKNGSYKEEIIYPAKISTSVTGLKKF